MPTILELLQTAVSLHRSGQPEQAAPIYEQVLAIDPASLEALVQLGILHRQQGRLSAAEDCFRRAVGAHPAAAVAHFHLGNVLQLEDRLPEALAHYRQAVRLQPDFIEAECNLGTTLRELGLLDQALVQLQRAAARRPDLAHAQANLGAVLHQLGRLEDAQDCFERAVKLDPARVESLFSLGAVLRDRALVEQSITWYDRALQIQPEFAPALVNRGTARLSLGQFTEGWADYEHRIRCAPYNTLRLPQPVWDGSALAGRRLLIHCEQGLGDTLQFIRYLRLVGKREQNVTVAANASLVPLLTRSGYAPVTAVEDPLPLFDVHAPLMSLPRIFGTQVDTVPAEVPYLSVEPSRVDRLRVELEKHHGFKVGVAWQGRPGFPGDNLRSIPLVHFAPLAGLPGVKLLSLQKGPGAEQVAALGGRFEIVDLAPSLDDDGAFLDTAAAMQSLDLVISSDTAAVHLAGALGVRVWVALSAAPDWRWMYGRDDSPWYPTLRLFRQRALGQWPDVFTRMAGELQQLVADSSPTETRR